MKRFAANSFVAGALLLCALGTSVIAADSLSNRRLERVRYNHPGLTVDLGVGLYGFPLPIDLEGDGDMDLIVTCPDRPYNGSYLFENPRQRPGKFPVFRAGKRLGPGPAQATLSWVKGQP